MAIGLDESLINDIDLQLAVKRIQNDLQTDFIYAPHLSIIFHKAANELWEFLSNKFKSNSYDPRLPIILEVPKASGFTRPGSILWPCERLAYQVVVDTIAPEAEKALDRTRVFSNVLLENDPQGYMFKSPQECYREFQDRKKAFLTCGDYSYVLKADISSFFERLYQHVLINLLSASGCNSQAVIFLQKLLSAFTQKDSHGIVQGVYPSDFLGTFYLCDIDTNFQVSDIPSVRYVDDIFAFFKTERDVLVNKIQLSSWLRSDGLNLNESKTKPYKVEDFIREETEIERMFEQARQEANSELQREDFYSSMIPLDFLYEDTLPTAVSASVPELAATKSLFAVTDVSSETRDKIDKVCLTIFIAAKDEIAVDYVLDKYISQPYRAQLYAKYLQPFVKNNEAISEKVETIFSSADLIYDFQLHWLYALLMVSKKVNNEAVNIAIRHIQDFRRSDVIRAVSACFIGKFGSPTQRRILKNHYQKDPSPYVRAAIIYALRHFPKVERDTCFRAWGGHDEINHLVITAIKRMISDSEESS